jgi:hypothetical protein
MESKMADEPKKTEPGFFGKTIELVDGKASAKLVTKSIDAYAKGDIIEGMKLARESNREGRKHLVEEVKDAAWKMNGLIQQGEVKVIKTLGGDEAAELMAKAFKAGDEGHGMEKVKLALKAEAKVPGHIYDLIKDGIGKLMGVTGGEQVKGHDGVPSLPTKPATKDQGHNP